MGPKSTFCVIPILGLLLTVGCGQGSLTSVAVSPATADAQNYPGGQVQFTATGTYGSSSKMVPLKDITWCVGSKTGSCNGNIAAAASVDGKGLAQCVPNGTGTVTILAGKGTPSMNPDGGEQLRVFGIAQLTCP